MEIPYKHMPGEAAFYGPKIDIKLVDALGRLWQLSTVQFDFILPRRFGLEYTGADGQSHQPLMVHRALLGSIERFFGVLIEHYAGAFPVWLAPVQAMVLPVSDKHLAYAREVAGELAPREYPGAARRPEREAQCPHPRCAVAEGSLHAGGGRSRRRRPAPWRRAGGTRATRVPAAWTRFVGWIRQLIDTRATKW